MPTRRWVVSILVAAGIAGCHEGRHRELEGTYDVTATLEQFRYKIPGSSPGVDCAPSSSYCAATEGAKGAVLSVTMFVGHPSDDESEVGETFFLISGTSSGQFCAAVEKTTGCTGLTPSALAFPASLMTATDHVVFAKLEIGSTGPAISMSSGPMQGDSLAGTISWFQPLGGDPASYSGHFVARKRR